MARARIIKPGFFKNEDLASLPPLARLLWAGIWTIADREGRLEDRPRKIKAEVLPYDDCDGDALVTALVSAGFLARYAVNGRAYLQVVNWASHQQPHVKEQASTIPAPGTQDSSTEDAPDMHRANTVQTPDMHGSSTEDAPLDTRYQILELTPPTPLAGGDSDADRTATRASPGYSADFLAFYAAYPKHENKKAAYAQWKKLRPSPELIDTIMASVERQKQGRKWMEGFASAPDVFLRGEKWEDEPEPVRMIPNGRPSQADHNRPGQRNPDGTLKVIL